MTRTLPDDLDPISPGPTRRRDDGYAVPRMLGVATVVVGIVGSIFAAGYNWRSVADMEKDRDNYVRKDVQQEQLNNVNFQLTEIRRQLEALRIELDAQRRK